MMRPLDPARVTLRGTTVIEASAGTGKTYTITSLVLRLVLEQELPISRILVVTYTRAATAELRQRIRARLSLAERMAQGEALDDPLLEQLCRDTATRVGQAKLRELLGRALADVDEAPVLTIHGFCQRSLSEHAFESGAGLTLEVATSAAPLLAEIADDYFTGRLYGAEREQIRPLLSEPEKLRRLAARAGDDLRILPGPSAMPDFDEAAWQRAFARCQQLWREQQAQILTLMGAVRSAAQHLPGWCSQWEEAFRVARPGCSSVCSEAGRVAFTRSKIREKLKKGALVPEHDFFDAMEELVALEQAFSERALRGRTDFRREFLEFLRSEIARRSREHNLHTFDALLSELAHALASERGASLTAVLRRRYAAALVDEFQDTDPLQYRIFHGIFGFAEGCLCLIGDPKQAIYAFRGADVHAFLSARAAAGERVYTLGTNRRSDPGLIGALNAFYGSVAAPFLLQDIDYLAVDVPSSARDRLRARDGRPALDFLLIEGHPQVDTLRQNVCRSVAADIARLLQNPAEIAEPGRTPAPLKASDVAVLCRTNRQALAMQQSLSQFGVRSVFQGDESVFRSDDASEIERLLEALAQPSDPTVVKSFLCSWYGGLDAHALRALEHDDAAWQRHREQLLALHELFLRQGFVQAVRGLLSHYHVEQRLLARADGARRITNLWHLIELLSAAAISQRLGPLGLLRWFRVVRLDEVKRAELVGEDHELRLESNENAVKLTTVHKSKGLEYPVVYCPFLWAPDEVRASDGEFVRFHDPAADYALTLDLGSDDQEAHRALAAQEALAEGLRLLYVALTRAKHRVCVTVPNVKGLGKSALGYSLFGGGDPTQLAERVKALDEPARAAELHARLGALGAQVGLRAANADDEPAPLGAALDGPELRAKAIRRALDVTRRVSSFSGLTAARAGAHGELGQDHDATDQASAGEAMQPSSGPLAEPRAAALALDDFPRGAAAGQLVHTVLENVDFAAQEPELRQAVEALLGAQGFASHHQEQLARGLVEALNTPLGHGFSLADIPRAARLHEMEFVLPVTNTLTPHALERAFREQRAPHALPGYAADLKELGFEKLTGYLRGFVDLIFVHEGRFYLVDYKSNWLGHTAEDYQGEPLARAMAEHHYFLQYHLYCVALQRYLALRLPGYDYERHFGGVYYLFLRGMSPAHGPGCGVFYDRPSRELLTALERCLGQHASTLAGAQP